MTSHSKPLLLVANEKNCMQGLYLFPPRTSLAMSLGRDEALGVNVAVRTSKAVHFQAGPYTCSWCKDHADMGDKDHVFSQAAPHFLLLLSTGPSSF